MDKKVYIMALIIYCLLISACSYNSKELKSDHQQIKSEYATSSVNDVAYESTIQSISEVYVDTTTTIETTTENATTLNQLPKINKELIWIAPNSEILYKEDGVIKDSVLVVDKACYRPSKGFYYDNISNPEMFEFSSGEYIGECIDVEGSEYIFINDSDHLNEYEVKCECRFNISTSEILSNSISFHDNIKLMGTVILSKSFYSPTYSEGDIWFIPDRSYKGLPITKIYTNNESVKPIMIGELIKIYCDTPFIYLGNIDDYNDNSDVINYFNNEIKDSVYVSNSDFVISKSTVTIESLNICFRNFMGNYSNDGVILKIEPFFE